MKDFQSEASKIAFELFSKTGNIGYYMLYSAIESPELEKIESDEREM